MTYPADVVLANWPYMYMVRHRSRRRLVLRECIPRYDLSLWGWRDACRSFPIFINT